MKRALKKFSNKQEKEKEKERRVAQFSFDPDVPCQPLLAVLTGITQWGCYKFTRVFCEFSWITLDSDFVQTER